LRYPGEFGFAYRGETANPFIASKLMAKGKYKRYLSIRTEANSRLSEVVDKEFVISAGASLVFEVWLGKILTPEEKDAHAKLFPLGRKI
jgi:hypothetical protein